MAMASVKEQLLNSLKGLTEDHLKEFQWHLENDHESITTSDMENADRLKTVDKMVACFGPEEAVKITLEILRKMNQNNLAEQLENKCKHIRMYFSIPKCICVIHWYTVSVLMWNNLFYTKCILIVQKQY